MIHCLDVPLEVFEVICSKIRISNSYSNWSQKDPTYVEYLILYMDNEVINEDLMKIIYYSEANEYPEHKMLS